MIFEVAATGSAPLLYQWVHNGKEIIGEQSNKLIIDKVSSENGGEYSVVVSNVSNSAKSVIATLTISTPPIISKMADDQLVGVGESVELWVDASGAIPMSFQWKREGVVVADGTGSRLLLNNLNTLHTGQYTVEITNPAGVVVSEPVNVRVITPPEIVASPESKQIGLGAKLILTVSAAGNDLSYQWYYGGEKISGAIEPAYVIPNAKASDSGEYHVKVGNNVGSVVSEIANVVVVAAPQILAQPSGGHASIGGDFAMNVEAKGSGDIAYQWRLDGVNVEGATQASLILRDLKMSDAGVYTVSVSNAAGTTTSDEAIVQVLMPVAINSQPKDQSVVSGESVLLDVAVIGSNPITYQWFVGNTQIEGENNAALRIENVEVDNIGQYHVVASNPVSTVISEFAKLVVNLPPQIVQHPVGQTAVKGDSVQLAVRYSGTGPFEFQWQRNGLELEGKVEDTLVLAQVDVIDDAEYSVIVRNPYGFKVSNPAQLKVTLPVTITSQPEDKHVAVDTELNLTVTANGTGPFEYQWFRGGDAIVGATEAKLSVPDITRKDQGLYIVQIKNMLGAVLSRNALVVVNEPVSLVTQPKGKNVIEGGYARFWVAATGSEPFSYQWYLNGEPIEGKTRSSMTVNQAAGEHEGAYTVIVTNPVGFKVSNEAFLNVNTAPRIKTIPSVVLAPGDSMEVKVEAEDFDGDNAKIKYSLKDSPTGMRILRNGLLKWTVDKHFDSGTINVKVIAKDEHGVEGSAIVEIIVNRPPKLHSVEDQILQVGEVFIFQPSANDPEEGELSFDITEIPNGASYTQVDGLRWVPLPNQTGLHELTVSVVDQYGFEDAQQLTLKVNAPPADPLVMLYSSGDVNAEYALDPNAQLDVESNTLTIRREGPRRFYRLKLRESGAIRIADIFLNGEDVIRRDEITEE